ncbi:MAG: formate--tetrahydrofolate ligase [Candidatus Odinarchaeota archaeon]|nr:formate--tetrahydrofolate ligase [Candidatus Odinarchaeota archaeon]
MLHISEIAKKAGIDEKYIEFYGKYMAKVDLGIYNELGERKGKLILVTAMTPTRYGEGKTTTSIGLTQALNRLNKRSIVTLREPSMGPVFGVKGGATGGGKSKVLPMENINLHFTGDIHAVSAAHNLLAAMIDNHIYHKNLLNINVTKVYWPRAIDMNDRALRKIVIGLGGSDVGGIPREDYFVITAASEVMAVLGLARDYKDLRERLGKIIVARTRDRKFVTARDLKADGAMTVLLKDALKPNLVQTTEGYPAFVHGGPFANIAHGTNSIIATDIALRLFDYVVTESGFGSDLGAEKFVNIVTRLGKWNVDASVVVASIRALKHHGNGDLEKGLENLGKHIENMQNFGIPVVVAVNRFPDDTDDELHIVKKYAESKGARAAISEAFAKGGEGTIELAKEVLEAVEESSQVKFTYDLEDSLKTKIEKVSKQIYGAADVAYTADGESRIKFIEKNGFGNFPVCIAKTQLSLSDNPKLLGRPEGFTVTVRDGVINAGAGFNVILMGKIITMPGLPKEPAANNIYLEEDGTIKGVF